MPSVYISVAGRNAQPQTRPKIKSYWLSRGLSHAFIGGIDVEVVHGLPEALLDDATGKLGRYNKGLGSRYFPSEDTVNSTIIGNLRLVSNDASYGALGWGFYVSGTDNYGFLIGMRGDSNKIYVANRRNSATVADLETITLPYEATWALAGAAGATARAFKNGVFFSNVAWSGAAFAADNRKRFGQEVSAGRSSAWRYRFASILTDAEIKSLSDNPWRIFEPEIYSLQLAASDTQLSGVAIGTSASSGALTTSIPLAGAALSSAGASGQVTTAIALSASVASVSAAGGNLTAEIMLSGAAVSAAAAAAGLTTAVTMSGAAQSTSAATGDLTIQIRLQGAALSQAIASGSLDAGSGISGAASVAAAASGALTTAIPVIGAALSVSGASGALSTAILLGSAAAASAQASANLGTNIQLSGVAASVTSGVGSLNTAITLTGNAVAQALSGGNLMANITLSGAAVAQVAANGQLNAAASVPTPISRTLRIVSEYRALRANAENRILRAA